MMFLRLRARLWHPVVLLCVLLAVLAACAPMQKRAVRDRWIVLLDDALPVEQLLDVEQPDRAKTLDAFQQNAAIAQMRFLLNTARLAYENPLAMTDYQPYWIVSAMALTTDE